MLKNPFPLPMTFSTRCEHISLSVKPAGETVVAPGKSAEFNVSYRPSHRPNRSTSHVDRRGKDGDRSKLSEYKALNDIEARTGVPKTYTSLVCTVLWALVFFDIGAQLVVNLVGFIYPAFCSLKALETPTIRDDEQWLTYWVVFGFSNVAEYFRETLMSVIPFYDVVKLAFLLWLYLPFTNGAEQVYKRAIKPAFQVLTTGRAKRTDNGPSVEPTKSAQMQD